MNESVASTADYLGSILSGVFADFPDSLTFTDKGRDANDVDATLDCSISSLEEILQWGESAVGEAFVGPTNADDDFIFTLVFDADHEGRTIANVMEPSIAFIHEDGRCAFSYIVEREPCRVSRAGLVIFGVKMNMVHIVHVRRTVAVVPRFERRFPLTITRITLTTIVVIRYIGCYSASQRSERQETMKRYVIYTRVSTEDQGRSGLGLEAQRRDIDLFLVNFSEEPWEVIGEYQDVMSGKNDDRPQLAAALRHVRATGAELLIAKLDRLSRKVSFIANIMDDKKVRLRVASMPFADNFQLHIYAALAEQEREFISKRTKAALQMAKERGRKLGGLRDTTARRNEAIQRKAQAEAEKLIKIIGPLREAGQALATIAATLNDMDVATSRGGTWTPMQVKRVLDRVQRFKFNVDGVEYA